MPTIDAGIFVILLGVGFGSIFMGGVVRNGYVFKLVGAFLFFALGIMMNAEYDVAYTVITDLNDGSEPITDKRYVVGDGSGEGNHAWLGWLFIGLGLAWTAFFFMDIFGAGILR